MADNPFSNAEFRGELEQTFDRHLKPVTDLLKEHDQTLREHEAALQRARGARWAFHVIWVGLVAIFEYFFHSGGKH